MTNLSTGIVARLNVATEADEELMTTPHTLQVLSIKPVNQGSERFRIIVSDGEYYLQAMLGTQHNEKVHTNELVKNAIVETLKLTTNAVHNKRCVSPLAANIHS
jgi:replication factor A1